MQVQYCSPDLEISEMSMCSNISVIRYCHKMLLNTLQAFELVIKNIGTTNFKWYFIFCKRKCLYLNADADADVNVDADVEMPALQYFKIVILKFSRK